MTKKQAKKLRPWVVLTVLLVFIAFIISWFYTLPSGFWVCALASISFLGSEIALLKFCIKLDDIERHI